MAKFAKELQKLAALATAPATNDVPAADPEATTPGP
jgi:hypothetical protein